MMVHRVEQMPKTPANTVMLFRNDKRRAGIPKAKLIMVAMRDKVSSKGRSDLK